MSNKKQDDVGTNRDVSVTGPSFDDLKFRELTLGDMKKLDAWSKENSDAATAEKRFEEIGQIECSYKLIHIACKQDIGMEELMDLIPISAVNDLMIRVGIPFAEHPGGPS